MATIKAGTYRFNDALVLADVPRENEISCPVNFVLNTVAAEFGIPLTANCDKIFVHSQCMSYHVVYTDPDMTATGATLPWSYPIYAVEGYRDFGINGWNTVNFDEGIRTITVTADAEASDEFYEWFTTNAVEQKEISGKWRFNDYLTRISGLQESVNFAAKYSYEYQGTHSGTVSCSGLSFIEGDGCKFRVRSMINGLSDPTDQVIAEALFEFTYPFETAIYREFMDGEYEFTFIPQGVDFQTIDFGTTPQYVSVDFYNWLTANAIPATASITHNGSTIAELFPGQTATLKCKGMKMEDDVMVAVGELPETEIPEPKLQEKTITENGEYFPGEGYEGFRKVTVAVESTGGGLAINGIIEQYKVNAGATVKAGDFVEFVNKFGSGTFDSSVIGEASPTTTDTHRLSACKLDNSRVLVAYSDGGSGEYGKAVVLSLDDTGVTAGTAVTFESAETSAISAVTLSPDKALVAYVDGGNSSKGTAVVLAIDGISITVGTTSVFSTNSTTYLSAVALSEEKVVICYQYYSSKYYSNAALYSVKDTTMTLVVNSTIFGGSASNMSYISAVALSENRVFVTYVSAGTTGTRCGLVLLVSNMSISAGTVKQISTSTTSNAFCKAVKLTENKVLVACRGLAKATYGNAVVLTTDDGGTTLTLGTTIAFTSATIAYISAVALSEDKALVVYQDGGSSNYGTAIVLTIDDTTITVGEGTAYDFTSTTYSDVVAFSESSVLVVHNSGAGLYTGLTIDGTTITVDGVGKYVKPATGRLHNVGVAATGGAEGETVDVYVVS
jgi:hypothetical protein